ncbi:protein phosphatase CheZ [Dechloromonas sp. ZS-1]|uniref:protein phosphatase CheZ n=1 Tax=Dechloromonas sp. ZS-1 TaxID=3138067 RepID=UPI0031FC14AA
MTATNDSSDLEALFDSIAADVSKPAPVAAKPVVDTGSDSDDLQALFDSVSAAAAPVIQESGSAAVQDVPEEQGEWTQQEAVFNRIGHMARTLHDTLGQLGYDKVIEQAVSVLPDAKDRLAYVANLTEQAACKVLNATDVASPIVDDIANNGQALAKRWDAAFANQLTTQDFRQLAVDTRSFLGTQLPEKTAATHAQLTEIMMAQDFQDLTGQVIKKIVALAQELESGLMAVLLEVVPPQRQTDEVKSLMNGPVVNAEGRTDVVVNQGQVDDLLESLGF